MKTPPAVEITEALESALSVDPSPEFAVGVRRRAAARRRIVRRRRSAGAALAVCGLAGWLLLRPPVVALPDVSGPRHPATTELAAPAVLTGVLTSPAIPEEPVSALETVPRRRATTRADIATDRLVVQTSQPELVRRLWQSAREGRVGGVAIATDRVGQADNPPAPIRVEPIPVSPIVIGSVLGESTEPMPPAIQRIRRASDAAERRSPR